ncbi:VOC family protein [Zavarzinia compransoris]|uniref:Dioxygenase n=1 Tax=Zavarzinia compransoris TaxID=1264899 RepID=A0A317E6P3_9PROT|nr:VOC family protein [Zavarzinia compransoris]PWR21940.1 dioxygenase [Zavarzinia compransoris]TDP47323.1 hypothetical protein DES42_103495 [Zavarzinia compransoris]
MRPFHLAFPVGDLDAAKAFYGTALGCTAGRSTAAWADFDLYGHQLSAHLRPGWQGAGEGTGGVDGDAVPIPHFGVVLTMPQWQALRARLEARDDIRWILTPKVRFVGQPGEQATLFILDPSGNALEFKGFASDEGIFAPQ